MSFVKVTSWMCVRCAYTVQAREAPKSCPACNDGKSFHYVNTRDDHDENILLSR